MGDDVHAGFPSPAQDYLDGLIDLNRELVRHPAATFYGRVTGNRMAEAGVEQGDILVIDKAVTPKEGDMAVCFLNGEFTLKFISFKEPGKPVTKAAKAPVSYNILNCKDLWLLSADPDCKPVHIDEGNDFTVWGVVTYVIKKIR